MKIAIKEVLKSHYEKTGEYVTQVQLARDGQGRSLQKSTLCTKYAAVQHFRKSQKPGCWTIEFLSKRFGVTN